MKNRRRSHRHDLVLPVVVKSAHGVFKTKTVNASAHGVAVFAEQSFAEGAYAELELALPDGRRVSVTAVATRMSAQLTDKTGVSGPGVAFDFYLFDAQGREAWRSLMDKLGGMAARPAEPPQRASAGEGQTEHAVRVGPATHEDGPSIVRRAKEAPPEPPPSSPPDDDRPTFLIKPRDVERLKAFMRSELTTGRVRIETPVLKEVGSKVELVVVHPVTDAEWTMEGAVVSASEHGRGRGPMLEIGVPGLTEGEHARFRGFVQHGRSSRFDPDAQKPVRVPLAQVQTSPRPQEIGAPPHSDAPSAPRAPDRAAASMSAASVDSPGASTVRNKTAGPTAPSVVAEALQSALPPPKVTRAVDTAVSELADISSLGHTPPAGSVPPPRMMPSISELDDRYPEPMAPTEQVKAFDPSLRPADTPDHRAPDKRTTANGQKRATVPPVIALPPATPESRALDAEIRAARARDKAAPELVATAEADAPIGHGDAETTDRGEDSTGAPRPPESESSVIRNAFDTASSLPRPGSETEVEDGGPPKLGVAGTRHDSFEGQQDWSEESVLSNVESVEGLKAHAESLRDDDPNTLSDSASEATEERDAGGARSDDRSASEPRADAEDAARFETRAPDARASTDEVLETPEAVEDSDAPRPVSEPTYEQPTHEPAAPKHDLSESDEDGITDSERARRQDVVRSKPFASFFQEFEDSHAGPRPSAPPDRHPSPSHGSFADDEDTYQDAGLEAELLGRPPAPRSEVFSAEPLSDDEARNLDIDIDAARARVERLPESATAVYQLGKLLMKRGAAEEALARVEAVVNLEPNHPGAHHTAARLLASLGRYDSAAEHLQKARRLGYQVDTHLAREISSKRT